MCERYQKRHQGLKIVLNLILKVTNSQIVTPDCYALDYLQFN